LTPPRRQTLFFSATMPPEITRLTTQFLKDPTRIEASRPAMTAETIAQHLAPIPSSDPKAKRLALRALIERSDVKNGIVFCNRKSEVDIVAKSLKRHGFDAAAIHGDLDQSVRTRTLAAFRNGELKLLVASDVAARGLDIPDVSHVFNYDVPIRSEDYVHRIGRTGRAGRSGKSLTIVTRSDTKYLDAIEKLIGQKLEWHDGELSTLAPSEGEEADRPPRGRGSSRRGGHRDEPRKGRKARAEHKAAEAGEAESAAPASERSDRQERKDAIRTGNATRKADEADNAKHSKPRRTGRSTQSDDDGDKVTVGFGDDVPAFMKIPAKV